MSNITNADYCDQVNITIKNKQRKIKTEEEFLEALTVARETEGDIVISLVHFMKWSIEFLRLLVEFYAQLEGRCSFRFEDQHPGGDLLRAAIGINVDGNNLTEYGFYRTKLMTITAIFYGDAVGLCSKLTKTRLEQLGGSEDIRTLKREIEATRDEYHGSAIDACCSELVLELFSDAPANALIMIPSPYVVRESGMEFCGARRFFSCPVLITSRLVDANTNAQKVKLAWLRAGIWTERVVPRKTIADAQLILHLAEFGLPVNSRNARELCSYLTEFESQNLKNLPIEHTTARLGFHELNGKSCFVLPHATICEDKVDLSFSCSNSGFQQIADGYCEKGNYQEWLCGINQIGEFPKVLLAVMASLAPSLSAIFPFQNLIVDYCGRTSGGKTTALRLAASVWGNPNERARSSTIHSWSGTKTFTERAAGMANDLPLIIDDSKNAASDSHVSDLIYMISQGHGRGRATIEGVQSTVNFNTICLISGERPATSFSKDGGTRARTLSLWGSPFGEFSVECGQIASVIDQIAQENYGFAGHKFVKFLLSNTERWDEWREEFETEKAKYVDWANEVNNQFVSRMAPALAAITMAHWLAHQCFALEFEYFDLFETIWEQICKEASGADQARAALIHIYEFANSNQSRFCGRSSKKSDFIGPCYGRWGVKDVQVPTISDVNPGQLNANNQIGTWPWIGFIESVLRKELADSGFDADAVIRSWKDNNWLVIQESGRLKLKSRLLDGESVRLIAISRAAIEEVCDLN